MHTPIQNNKRIVQFRTNLDLHIMDLELSDEGYQTDIFFDAADMRNMLLGMYAFYIPDLECFETTRFDTPRTMVQMVAASGLLGELQMLPSHEAELKHLIEGDFGLGDVRDNPHHLAKDFLLTLGIIDPEEGPNADAIRRSLSRAPERFIRRHASHAPRLFRALQCIKGDWRGRLNAWQADHKSTRLKFGEDHGIDFAQVLHSPNYRALKNAFDLRRSAWPESNRKDAFALAYLIELSQRVQSGRIKSRMPCFFASSPYFQSAAELAHVDHLLFIEFNNKRVPILRDVSYFLFRVEFTVPSLPESEATRLDYPFASLDELRRIRDQILELEKVPESDLNERLAQIVFRDRTLDHLIRDVEHQAFFPNVWLPFIASRDVQDALQALHVSSVLLEEVTQLRKYKNKARIVTSVNQVIRETLEQLERNASRYRLATKLLDDVQTQVHDLRLRMKRAKEEAANIAQSPHRRDSMIYSPANNADYVRDFGMMRFGLPEEAYTQLNEAMRNLMSANIHLQEQELQKISVAVSSLRRQQREPRRLPVTAAILWILKFHDLLIELLSELPDHPDNTLLAIYAAALISKNQRLEEAERLIGILKSRLKPPKKGSDETEAAAYGVLTISIAYLYWRLACRRGFRPSWRPEYENTAPVAPEAIALAELALKYIAEGAKASGLQDQRRAYALNLYLYLLVEVNFDNRKHVDHMCVELNRYRNTEAWQSRCEDTVGRYYHSNAFLLDEPDETRRLPLTEDGLKRAEDWLRRAEERYRAAIDGTSSDREAIEHLQEVREDLRTIQARASELRKSQGHEPLR